MTTVAHKPPSSRGPGRDPFKVKTGVRISVGAPIKTHLELRILEVEQFLAMIPFKSSTPKSIPRIDPSGQISKNSPIPGIEA